MLRNIKLRRKIVVFFTLLCLLVTSAYIYPNHVQAASTNYDFSSSSNYTFDNTKIQVTGGQAQLGRGPAGWWDTNYAYRKSINVTASSSIAITTTDTITLKTDAAALVSGAKMQADHDDLRIVHWNGSSNTNIDRQYIANGLDMVINSGTDQNDIRFQAQAALSAGSSTTTAYYMYYGYSSATPGPQATSSIYRYFEDFSTDVIGGGTWTTSGSGWSVSGGKLTKTSAEAIDRFAVNTGTSSLSSTNGWFFESDFRRTSASNSVSGAGTMSGITSPTGWWAPTFYSGSANDIEIWRSAGKLSDGTGTIAVLQNTDYTETLRFSRNASCASGWATIKVWLDGTKYNSANETNTLNCPSAFYPGFHAWNSTAEWDNYRVWQFLDETVTVGSEETTYPTDDPTIRPSTSLSFDTLSDFTETATTNGGSIRYVLSNDGGTTWYYYSGGWTTSNDSYAQANSATDVDTNIATFPRGAGNFKFKAFLRSSGTQLVQLDNISVSYNNYPAATFDNDFTGWSGGTILVNYNLIELDSDTVNISQTASSGIEYSTDGNTWTDATQGSGGDGLTGLTATTSPGTNHIFAWASATDLSTTEDTTVYLRVRPNDGTASTSTWATSSPFAVDNVAPSGVGAPTFGTLTSSSIVINKPTTVTEGGVLGQWQARRDGSLALGLNSTTTSSDTDSGLSENTQYTYAVQFTDAVGNTSSYGTTAQKYTLADTPTNLAGSSASNSIVLTVDSFPNASSGSSGYYFDSGTANSGWITTNTWTDTTVSCGNTYNYTVKYRNGDGTETSTAGASVAAETCGGGSSGSSSSGGGGGGIAPPTTPPPPPTPSADNPTGEFRVIINNGAASTNNREVSLDLAAGEGTQRMAISMTGDFNDSGQEDYRAIKLWDLCSSYIGLVRQATCPDGTYTVYVKFYSASGVASSAVSDSIILDTTPVPVSIPTPPPPPPVPVVPKPIPPRPQPTPIPRPTPPDEPVIVPAPPTQPTTPTTPSEPAEPTPPAEPVLEGPVLESGGEYLGSTKGYLPLQLTNQDGTLELIAGTTLKKVVKPIKPVKSITVRIIFKKPAETSSINWDFIKNLFSRSAKAQEWEIAEYVLTDIDGDGTYEADITMPYVAGEYEIDTIIVYKDGTVEVEETVTLIDPRGYVYESIFGKEARVPDVKVSIYAYDAKAKRFVLWPAQNFDQQNPQNTNKTGEYAFLVPEGKYYLLAEADGYPIYRSADFDVKEGDFISQNIELKPFKKFDKQWLISGAVLIVGLALGLLFRRRRQA